MTIGMLGILVPILITLFLFTMIVLIRRYDNKEKMAMIEKGIDPGSMTRPNQFSNTGLRFALLAIGGGVGLLIGNLIESFTSMDDEVAYFSMLFIFGGIGLLISHFILEKKMEKEKKENERKERILH